MLTHFNQFNVLVSSHACTLILLIFVRNGTQVVKRRLYVVTVRFHAVAESIQWHKAHRTELLGDRALGLQDTLHTTSALAFCSRVWLGIEMPCFWVHGSGMGDQGAAGIHAHDNL